MLCSIKALDGYALAARDGEIGHAREAYFDDERWAVRHLVADTGGWLSNRKVLISPHSIGRIDRAEKRIEVTLTRQQIQDAPGIETDQPVSRQHEIPYYDYYGYPYYWSGSGLWGVYPLPMAGEGMLVPPPDTPAERELAALKRASTDTHLRSSAEVSGYDIEATDGSIGHVDDFLFDDGSWEIRWVIVDTRKWLPGRRVMVPREWITAIDWNKRCARVRASKAAVKESPEYKADAPMSVDEERSVQKHYESWL